jgi:hypothetical protein
MSLFVIDPMVRVYGLGEDPKAADFLRRMGLFLRSACAVTSYKGDLGKPLDFPRYAMLFDGRDGQVNEWDDPQHSLEVAAGIAYAHYFAESLGKPDPSLKDMATRLLTTYRDGVGGWIRPSGPMSGLAAYRVAPWRKYNWEYRPSGSAGWALKQSGRAESAVRPTLSRTAAAAPDWVLGQGGLRRLAASSAAYDFWIDPLGRVAAVVPKRATGPSRSPSKRSP